MAKLLHLKKFWVEPTTHDSEILLKHMRITFANYQRIVNGIDKVENNKNNYLLS